MPRPNRDRIKVAFYLGRGTKDDVAAHAVKTGVAQADVIRGFIEEGLARAAKPARAARKVTVVEGIIS